MLKRQNRILDRFATVLKENLKCCIAICFQTLCYEALALFIILEFKSVSWTLRARHKILVM